MYFFVNDKIQEAGTPVAANQAYWPEILVLIEKGKHTYNINGGAPYGNRTLPYIEPVDYI